MDATQKRRMWKVAAIHFALSISAVVLIFSIPFGLTSMFQDFRSDFGYTIFSFLQPQFYFFSSAFNLNSEPPQVWNVLLISIPICSVCFGWLYTKLVNWLSHFPVLGKKVF
jgi:hypothetical protein